MPNCYTTEEEAYLRAHPSRRERAAVAARLGRTPAGVTQHLSLMGLISLADDRYSERGERYHHQAHVAPDDPLPPPDPVNRVARPSWFAQEGGESNRAFSRRLMGGR
jgi:hypothetical protein